MRPLLAIDPGKRHCGLALFEDGLLLRAATIRVHAAKAEPDGRRVGRIAAAGTDAMLALASQARVFCPEYVDVVVEFMQHYSSTKVDAADLIAVQMAAGVVTGALAAQTLTLVHPATWKGQVPAEIMWGRIRARLSPSEVVAARAGRCFDVKDGKDFHHGLEAIGIGLWATRRL